MLQPWLLAGLALLAQDGPVPTGTPPARDVRPWATAARLEVGDEIRLDGRLEEAAWARIEPLTEFRQTEPEVGGTPSEATEIRIAIDGDNLYVGALLRDSDPSGIQAHQRQRDAGLGTDDRFMWVLDTFLDGRTAYFFEINPGGLMGDGLLTAGASTDVNKSWDGIWEARVARGDYGWSAEIRIPFRTLNFNPASDTWGINFQRTIRRKSEEILWSGHLRNQGLFRPIHAGRLVGLSGISQGLGLEVTPYAAASWRPSTDPGSGTPADIGFDVNYSLTPGLRASLTVNTDFAEVEVDQRQVNLTRFPISYPERRDFFLEGSSVFNFRSVNGITPYFSRRIGLVEGVPVPVRFGARVAGQAGRYDLALVQVRTGAGELHPTEDFTAARVVRNFLQQSSLGAIYTRRGTQGGGLDGSDFGQHTWGADLELATSRFLGDRNLLFQALFATHTAGVDDDTSGVLDRTARGMRLTYPNEPWSGHVSYREFGTHFDPPVGFAPRRAFRRLQPTVGYSPRFRDHPYLRQLDFGVEYQHLMDLDFRPQTITADVTLLGVRFNSGDNFAVRSSNTYERLDRDFRIHPEVTIAGGEYSFHQWIVEAQTAGYRRVAGRVALTSGDFWSGGRTQLAGRLTLRPAPGMSLATDWERNDVRLREGEFDANLVRLSAGWDMNPWTSLTGNVQYDNLSERVGLYTRFRWILRPGSDLYLVYGHNWQNSFEQLLTLDRSATTKLTYTHRF